MTARPATPTRRYTTCALCHRECRSTRRICGNCVGVVTYRTQINDDDALTGGEWRVVRGIQRWFPAPAALAVAPRQLNPADMIACPTCHAKGSEQCRTKGGGRSIAHSNRLIPRCCPCGASLVSPKRLCSECAEESAERGRREYEARRARGAA